MHSTSRVQYKGRERMESVNVSNFLAVGYGYGYGSGYGSGDGSGYGSGDGSGDGDGSGYGSGSGSGYGVKTFTGKTVHVVDGVQTILDRVHGNVAKGYILQSDLSLTPCYVVKHDNLFAHGETLAEANESLMEKIFDTIDIDEKISMFLSEFKDGIKYPARKFYDWHHKLTGSCKAGRDAFIRDRGIDVENAEYTAGEFIALTEDAYGSDVIRRIKKEIKGG